MKQLSQSGEQKGAMFCKIYVRLKAKYQYTFLGSETSLRKRKL